MFVIVTFVIVTFTTISLHYLILHCIKNIPNLRSIQQHTVFASSTPNLLNKFQSSSVAYHIVVLCPYSISVTYKSSKWRQNFTSVRTNDTVVVRTSWVLHTHHKRWLLVRIRLNNVGHFVVQGQVEFELCLIGGAGKAQHHFPQLNWPVALIHLQTGCRPLMVRQPTRDLQNTALHDTE